VSGPPPEVSVVVPTRDRPASLARCLAALERQRDAGPLEVVVVDDGSESAAEVAAVVTRSPPARLVRAAGRGPAAARNAGVRAARGRVVCFTDDDCLPAPTWAARLGAALAAGADAAGGATVVAGSAPLDVASQTVVSHLVAHGGRRFAPTSSLACRRELAAGLPFDERFPDAAGEDRDWCARLEAAGLRLELVPDAVVRHHPALTPRSFWRQHVRYGRGARAFRSGRAEPLERPAFYLRLLASGFARGPVVGLLVVVAQLAAAVGFARGARGARRIE
jgi:glycosyltransferase involved in cell wall biosynthesis